MSAPYTVPGAPLRVSLLSTYSRCPLAAKMETQGFTDWSTSAQGAGTAIHGVCEEILRTLRRTGNRQIPTQEAIEIAYEYAASSACPHLSDGQLDELRWLTLQVAAYEWDSHRLVDVEERLMADIVCPDGKVRTLTGKPDALFADPPAGGILLDFKGGRKRPPKPRDGDWERDKGRPFLTGLFQLSAYGLLVFRRYPAIQRVILREHHIRWDETREAWMDRDDLEHVERRLGVLLQRLDMVLAGELEAEARPGAHCSYCPRPTECPIAADDRGEGTITDSDMARLVGERFVVHDSSRDRDRTAAKAWVDETGQQIPIGDGDAWVGWLTKADGGRSFDMHSGPADLRKAAVK